MQRAPLDSEAWWALQEHGHPAAALQHLIALGFADAEAAAAMQRAAQQAKAAIRRRGLAYAFAGAAATLPYLSVLAYLSRHHSLLFILCVAGLLLGTYGAVLACLAPGYRAASSVDV